MVDTINAIGHDKVKDVNVINVRCPVCAKVTTYREKSHAEVPQKSVSFKLHCANCGTTIGHYNNIR